MQKKSDAHEALSHLFVNNGVPRAIIMDGCKEQTMSDFRKKAQRANYHIRQTEPHHPWQNAAEGAIRELKRGTARKMLKTKTPKRL